MIDSLSRLTLTISWIILFFATIAGATVKAGPKGGELVIHTADGQKTEAPLLATDVSIEITGLIARVKVSQRFYNPGDQWAEGIYVFPLPETAAVDHMRLEAGGRIIEGKIEERKAARKKYETAKKAGKRASLVTQERPNIFTTAVANMAPREEVTVTIEYQQSVDQADGVYSIRFPLVVGPRYIPGAPVTAPPSHAPSGKGWSHNSDQVEDASRITPPVTSKEEGLINPVKITIDLAPGFATSAIDSPYHPVDIAKKEEGRYLVTLSDKVIPADRDFVLSWRQAPSTEPAATVYHQEKHGRRYTLFVITPPTLAPADEAKRQKREAIFVIDISGSMQGRSIVQAKDALIHALDRLRPGDTFNVIAFNHSLRPFSPRAEPVNETTIWRAKEFVRSLQASGGTEMAKPLTLALDSAGEDQTLYRLRQVIFLTDGAVGNEDGLFKIIRERLGKSRLFTVGIGSAPNSHFMRTAAELGRGAFTYIGKPEEVTEKMTALLGKLEKPALTNIRITTGDDEVKTAPSPIPDLYQGQPLTVVTRSDGPLANITLHGIVGGKAWQRQLELPKGEGRTGIDVLWARRKIAELMESHRKAASDTELRQSIRLMIVDVALESHLVSRFTSLVAVDVTPVRPDDQALATHAMKTNMPHGWSRAHVFGKAKTASPMAASLLAGLVCLFMGWQSYRLYQRSGS